MPIYEYECLDNKHRFEIIQRFSDPPVTHCTVCGGTVHRVVSAPAIQFKGSGWYITDYARKDRSEKSDSPAETKTETAKPSGSETTSASTSSTDSTNK